MKLIAKYIADALKNINNEDKLLEIRDSVYKLTDRF